MPDKIVSEAAGTATAKSLAGSPPTHVRHVVLGLTVAAYLITYMDRAVISSAVPFIQKEFGFSIVTMGWILSSFQWAYAIFQIPGGWLGDRFGPRRALAGIVAWWSIFTSATTLAWSAASMAAVRFLFGMGEAGAFPIATRSLSRWMLPSERGFAQGLTHAGSRVGGAVTPVLVAFIIKRYGWRAGFVSFGCLGFVWSAVWLWYYRDLPSQHKSVNEAELNAIRSGVGSVRRPIDGAVPWRRILSSRQMWVLSSMYFCYAYNMGVYLAWFPKYLHDYRGFGIAQMGIFATIPLLAGSVGDMAGGWLSDRWAKRTGDLTNARRILGAAGFLLAAISIIPACLTTSPGLSVACSALAVFGFEVTVGISWAIPLDIAGDYAGSVSSVMNTCGNVGGAIGSAVTAYLVMLSGWKLPFLVIAGLSVVGAILYLRIDASKKLLTPAS